MLDLIGACFSSYSYFLAYEELDCQHITVQVSHLFLPCPSTGFNNSKLYISALTPLLLEGLVFLPPFRGMVLWPLFRPMAMLYLIPMTAK